MAIERVVDTDARVLEAYELGTQGYRLVERAQGEAPVSLAAVPRSTTRARRAELWRH